jgi:hypothetical protein
MITNTITITNIVMEISGQVNTSNGDWPFVFLLVGLAFAFALTIKWS